MRKFRKSFSVDGSVNVSVEFDDDDIQFMTEEEIIEWAHERLREYAEDEESNYSLVDDMNDFEEFFEQAETPVLFFVLFFSGARAIGSRRILYYTTPPKICQGVFEKNLKKFFSHNNARPDPCGYARIVPTDARIIIHQNE